MNNQNIGKTRLYFIDNIRWLMIVFVVLMHINVTYSSMGQWYYTEPRMLDRVSTISFAMYGLLTQAYFMGFLFLISGYFVPGSIDKKGGWKFILDRLFRLGIPTLTYMLILHPITTMILIYFSHFVPPDRHYTYVRYLTSFDFVGQSGPLWFALALLIFSIIYAVFRILFPTFSVQSNISDNNPVSHKNLVLLALSISVIAFLIRLVFPLGVTVLNMHFGFFAQYVVLFCAGILAYRYSIFTRIPYRMGMTWFKAAIFAGIPLSILITALGGRKEMFAGGFNWQSGAFAFWESFFCIGICSGLLVLFRDRYNNQGKVEKFLSDNAFAVFVFHTPILVLITLLWKNWQVYPMVKWLTAALVVTPVSFFAACLLRKIPGIKQLFS